MPDIILKDEAYKIVGACFEVHNEIGAGFLEAVYQECLEREFELRKIPFKAQPVLAIHYKGSPLNKTYQPDFICYDQIVLEIKAVSDISDAHRAQTINYLKATEMPLGLLINFGDSRELKHERFVWTRHQQ